MTEFKRGDVVRLKSVCLNDCLNMTVEDLGQSLMGNEIECIWFDTDGKLQRERFKKETLVKV